MKNLILIIIYLSISFIAHSQDKLWQKGFIVNNWNDTIYGYIRTNNLTGYYKIQFKRQLIDRYVVYESKDLKEYNINGNVYSSILIPEELTGLKNYVLTKQLSGKDIKLYFSKYRYFSCPCEPEGSVNEGYILIKNNSIVIINKKSFSEKIKNPLELFEFLNDKQGNLNYELKFTDIPAFIDEYNKK